jgi:hypothetical protein
MDKHVYPGAFEKDLRQAFDGQKISLGADGRLSDSPRIPLHQDFVVVNDQLPHVERELTATSACQSTLIEAVLLGTGSPECFFKDAISGHHPRRLSSLLVTIHDDSAPQMPQQHKILIDPAWDMINLVHGGHLSLLTEIDTVIITRSTPEAYLGLLTLSTILEQPGLFAKPKLSVHAPRGLVEQLEKGYTYIRASFTAIKRVEMTFRSVKAHGWELHALHPVGLPKKAAEPGSTPPPICDVITPYEVDNGSVALDIDGQIFYCGSGWIDVSRFHQKARASLRQFQAQGAASRLFACQSNRLQFACQSNRLLGKSKSCRQKGHRSCTALGAMA